MSETLWLIRGPLSAWTLMACGRTFRSFLRHPTARKERYFHQVVNRHKRRCTKCKKAGREFIDVDPDVQFFGADANHTVKWKPLI